MLSYRPATAEQYQDFLLMMRDEMSAYVDRTMEMMHMSWEEFAALFQSQGQVMCICEDEKPAGFYWIEVRERTLHLHALILLPGYRNRGIGSWVLKDLENQYRAQVEEIELGVHESNSRATSLYERCGFDTIRTLPELGFFIMRKRLMAEM